MTTFYLVRHGETDWNVAKKVQGQSDIPLNENGRKQAKETGTLLKEVTFDIAFSSDLLRAKETTEIIALEKKLEVQTTELLRERRFGNFEGETFEAFATFDELIKKLTHEEKKHYKYDGSTESDNEIATRLITFLRETALTHPGKTVLVGTHGGIMRAFLVHLGHFTYDDTFFVRNGAFVKVRSDGVDFFIDELHQISKNESGALKGVVN